MERRGFSRKPRGVDRDLCFACHAIWFDQKRTLAELGEAESARAHRDPAKIVDGMLAGRRFEEPPARRGSRAAAPAGWAVAPEGLVDLVGEALDFLMSD